MISLNDLIEIEPFLFECPASYRDDMRVPARIYADKALLKQAMADRSIEQLLNTATLPGVYRYALAMPDIHQGYGFPIGGVAATELPNGIISPGGVGYDINCGVRLLTSSIQTDEIRPHMGRLMDALFRNIPAGVGTSGAMHLSKKELRAVLEQGSAWVIRKGMGTPDDLMHTEDRGRMEEADASAVSPRAIERGQRQLGTLGAGNHFIEVDRVVEIYDAQIAAAWGLTRDAICIWIHCGSRGLGHQVCTDTVRAMQTTVTKYHIEIPDRQLVCAPFSSKEGQSYFQAMSCAANYAWANRQVITHLVRHSFDQALGGHMRGDLRVLYDVCHNIAKVEKHDLDGREVRLCVHRKGATRAFGPGRAELPKDYRETGQPVLIPGSMGTGSYVLVGTTKAMQETFGSTCHGAGRVMSRSKARKTVRGEDLRDELKQADIVIRAKSMRGLAEEAPRAYKDVNYVVNVVHKAGIAHRIARTMPLGVIKG